MVCSVAKRVVALVVASGLASLPMEAVAQDPAPVTEPPPPPAPAAEPAAGVPIESTPTAPLSAASDDDEYARFVAAMPNDYDINYSYTAPAGGSKRGPADKPSSGPAKAKPRALGIAGGTFLTLGGVLGVTALGLGLGAKGDGELEVAAIGTGASGGVLMLLGTGLLLGKRAVRRKNGDLPYKAPMSASSRKQAILLGSVSATFGIIGIAGGAVLLSKDEDSKGGAALVALGAIFTAFSLWPIGALLANRARKNATVRLMPGPLHVRQGGGLALAGSF